MSYHRLDDQRHNIQYAPAPYAPGYVQPPPTQQQYGVPLYPVLAPTPTAPPAAVPIQAPPTMPQPSVAVAAPFAGSHIEPAYMSCGHRFLISICYAILCTLFGFNLYLYLYGDHTYYDDSQSSQLFLVAYCGILMLIIPLTMALKVPRRLELTPNCIILHTRLTSHSIPYERITSVEILPSLCCWFGSGCTFPKGGFTAFSNGIFIRSADCGQSIAFTPTDMNRIITHMRITPLANRIVQN